MLQTGAIMCALWLGAGMILLRQAQESNIMSKAPWAKQSEISIVEAHFTARARQLSVQ
jgi:hypothetical protein